MPKPGWSNSYASRKNKFKEIAPIIFFLLYKDLAERKINCGNNMIIERRVFDFRILQE
jgi:hypothetical protein